MANRPRDRSIAGLVAYGLRYANVHRVQPSTCNNLQPVTTFNLQPVTTFNL
ncbi:MAG: hypothetical protein F6K65_12920 [Moorea sp. SIO3C2]|nr:hypothetical protein [Moorena sp. SIO3C2]